MTERGIRRTPWGWQVVVRRQGKLYTKHFPPKTDLATLRHERDLIKARALLKLNPSPADAETFGADIETYLEAVKGMPTFADREYRMLQWRDALGSRRRRSEITATEIRQQLEAWRTEGLSLGSLNLRRTALAHFFAVLNGKAGQNPVKDVPRYRETPKPLRLPSLEDAEKAIGAVRAAKSRSKTRARLSVLLWTGWPAAQLMKLTLADVDFKNCRAYVTGRLKGAGSRSRWLPLLPQAVAALREFKRVKAWGTFSTSAMHSSLAHACEKAGVTPFNPYQLRHLFLTLVAGITKDDRAVAELAMHTDPRQTRRYTEQSVDPRILEALTQVAAALPATPATSERQTTANGGLSRGKEQTKGLKAKWR